MAQDPVRPVSDSDTSNPVSSGVDRRTLVRVLTAGGIGVTAATLPRQWTKPLVDAVVVPLHAQSTAPLPGLYGSSNSGQIFLLNTTTGAGTLIGTLPFGATDIEYNPNTGQAWAQLTDGFFAIHEFNLITATGIGSDISDGGSHTALEYVGSTLYASVIAFSGGPSELHTLTPSTGASVNVGSTGQGPLSGLAYNGTMYAIGGRQDSSPANLYTINLATGAATLVGATSISGAGSLQFGPDGNLYAGGDNTEGGNLYRVNTATGASTLVGATGFSSVTGLTRV